MSTTRMAGEELEKNKSLRERYGEDYINDVSQKGLQDATKKGSYSRKEIAAEFRNRSKDVKVNEGEGNMVDYYQGLADSGTKFNNSAKDFLKGHGVTFGGSGNGGGNGGGGGNSPEIPDTSPADPPSNPIDPPGHSQPPITSIDQTVNQDNDINNEVNGDGNTVNIGQDNSVGQYANSAKSAANGLMSKYVLNLSKNR